MTSTTLLAQPPVELRPLELLAPRRDGRLEALAQRVQGHAGLAVAHLTQRLRQLGVAAEEANARCLELVGRRGSRDRALRLGFEAPGRPSAETTIGPWMP